MRDFLLATHDYLAWNRARLAWPPTFYFMPGIPPSTIDGATNLWRGSPIPDYKPLPGKATVVDDYE